MEPTLTPSDPADDPLEALLRTPPPPIPDDGFTARVCAALPPRTASRRLARSVVLSGALLLGCLLSWLVWSSIDPTLPDAIYGWRLQTWQALPVIVALSAWAIRGDEPEVGIEARAELTN